MIQRYLTVLAPFGAVLMLIFVSMAAFDMMGRITHGMQTDVGRARMDEAHAQATTTTGLLGVLLFCVGMFNAVIAARSQGIAVRVLLIAAAFIFVLSVCVIGIGNSYLNDAFRSLATAKAIEPETFSQEFQRGRMPLLAGYSLIVVSAMLVFVAGLPSPGKSARRSPLVILVATGSLMLLLLAGVWQWRSESGFYDIMADASMIEPSQLAHSVLGAIRSVFLSLMGIAGVAVATLCLAFATSTGEIEDVA